MSKSAPKVALSASRDIPFNRLVLSQANAGDDDGIDDEPAAQEGGCDDEGRDNAPEGNSPVSPDSFEGWQERRNAASSDVDNQEIIGRIKERWHGVGEAFPLDTVLDIAADVAKLDAVVKKADAHLPRGKRRKVEHVLKAHFGKSASHIARLRSRGQTGEWGIPNRSRA